MIRDIRVNISTQTISWFLHRVDFEIPTDVLEIDHRNKEIKKVKTNHIGTD